MDQNEKREIIMNHYQNPINKKENNDNRYIKANTNNVSCIDNINVHVLYKDNIIKDITFDGEACAISISSTSIMIKNLIGKTVKEAIIFINEFDKMLDEKPYNKDILKDAVVYEDIAKQKSRKICASLPYRALKKTLKETNEFLEILNK